MRILDGRTLAFVAFDIGFEIDLDAATTLLAAGRAPGLRHQRPAPPSLRWPAPPVEVALADHTLPDGTTATVSARLFDFGVVSVCFVMPPPASVAELPARARFLAAGSGLIDAAARAVDDLAERVRGAVVRFGVNDVREEYFIFQVSALEGAPSAAEVLAREGGTIASALALEPNRLDESYAAEVLATRVSYSPDDLVLCDWSAAFVYDDEWDDAVAVLEFLNIQLLELRFQDTRLDRALERATTVGRATRGLGAFLNPYRQPVRELAELTIESALLSERVVNAMKLLGDDYLARVARRAAERQHLADWEATLRRKQEAVATMYTTLNDRLAVVRGEALELAIVLLIVFEILLWLGGRG
jgi:hypothetical protein